MTEPLSERHIVSAALSIIERVGLDALTMRRLADELGVTVGAAYKHVQGKEELLRLVVDEIYLRVEAPSPAGESALPRVRTILARFYELMAAYPGMAGYLANYPGSFGPVHLSQTVAGALADAGFAPPRVEAAMRVLFFYTSGALQVPGAYAGALSSMPMFLDGLDIVLAGLHSELRPGHRTKPSSSRARR